HDSAPAPISHAVDDGLHQLYGGEHIGQQCLLPYFYVPVPEVSWGRPTRVGDENIESTPLAVTQRLGCFQSVAAPFGCRDIARNGDDLGRTTHAQGFCSCLERSFAAGGNDKLHTFARQRLSACEPQPFARCANKRRLAANT